MNPLRAGALSPLLVAVSAALAPLPCQVPTTPEAVPIFAGAERQLEREASQPAVPGAYVRVYRVRAPVEEVVKFYQQRLGAREIRTEAERDSFEQAYERLGAGQATSVIFFPQFVDLSVERFRQMAGPGEDPARKAADIRAAYAAKRPPFRPGTWIQTVSFEWGVSPTAGQYYSFYLIVEDVGGWQIREPEYQHETQIVVNVPTTKAAPGEEM